MLDKFWQEIDRQLNDLRSARSNSEVFRILGAPDPDVADSHAQAFFAGGGGDGEVWHSLEAAGWTFVDMDADYYWCMKAPDGDLLTYVEGDIYPGNQMTTGRVIDSDG